MAPRSAAIDETDTAAAVAARRRFDANKVVITVGGAHSKQTPPVTPDGQKRLSDGRRAIEEHALQMQTGASEVVAVAFGQASIYVDDRLPPRRTNLQRSKIAVQTLSVPGGPAKMQRLKQALSTPVNADVVPVEPVSRTEQTLTNGGSERLQARNGRKMGNQRRRPALNSDQQQDGTIVSSYQTLDVDLDDDAIMV